MFDQYGARALGLKETGGALGLKETRGDVSSVDNDPEQGRYEAVPAVVAGGDAGVGADPGHLARVADASRERVRRVGENRPESPAA